MDTDGSLIKNSVNHRIDFIILFSGVKIKRGQFAIKLSFASAVHETKFKTLKKMVVDFRTNLFSPGQVYVRLSRVKKSDDFLPVHKEEHGSLNARICHQMSADIENSALKEAVRF